MDAPGIMFRSVKASVCMFFPYKSPPIPAGALCNEKTRKKDRLYRSGRQFTIFTMQNYYGFVAINQLPVVPAEYLQPEDMGTALAS